SAEELVPMLALDVEVDRNGLLVVVDHLDRGPEREARSPYGEVGIATGSGRRHMERLVVLDGVSVECLPVGDLELLSLRARATLSCRRLAHGFRPVVRLRDEVEHRRGDGVGD